MFRKISSTGLWFLLQRQIEPTEMVDHILPGIADTRTSAGISSKFQGRVTGSMSF